MVVVVDGSVVLVTDVVAVVGSVVGAVVGTVVAGGPSWRAGSWLRVAGARWWPASKWRKQPAAATTAPPACLRTPPPTRGRPRGVRPRSPYRRPQSEFAFLSGDLWSARRLTSYIALLS